MNRMIIKSVFNRTIWLYLVLFLVFAAAVNHQRSAYVRGRYLLGVFYNQNLSNFKDGLVYFDYMRHIKPHDPRYSFFLGYSYLQFLDFKKAQVYFERALAAEPTNALWRQYLNYTVDQTNGGPSNIARPEGTIAIPLDEE